MAAMNMEERMALMGIGDLSDQIKPSACYGLNISAQKPIVNLFQGDERLVCQSAEDEQMIINIPFSEAVMIHSINISAMEGEEAAFEKQHPLLSCLARTYVIVEGCVDRTSAWCCCGCPCLRRWESEEEKAWGREAISPSSLFIEILQRCFRSFPNCCARGRWVPPLYVFPVCTCGGCSRGRVPLRGSEAGAHRSVAAFFVHHGGGHFTHKKRS